MCDSYGSGDELRMPHQTEALQRSYFSDSGRKIKQQQLGKVWDFTENLQIHH
jgi:hypothetical protein